MIESWSIVIAALENDLQVRRLALAAVTTFASKNDGEVVLDPRLNI
jgi:hypothetical protein